MKKNGELLLWNLGSIKLSFESWDDFVDLLTTIILFFKVQCQCPNYCSFLFFVVCIVEMREFFQTNTKQKGLFLKFLFNYPFSTNINKWINVE